MKQWRKEPWVPLSLSDRSLSLWPRINVFTSCREVTEKIFSPEKSQRKSTETREVQCSLNSDLSNIQHVTQKGCSLLVIGDSKWNLHTGRSSAVQWTVNIIPSLKRERGPTQRREPVIFCSRGPEGRSRQNKHGGSKKIYKRKKWVYFVWCAWESIHEEIDLIYEKCISDLNSWWVWWRNKCEIQICQSLWIIHNKYLCYECSMIWIPWRII